MKGWGSSTGGPSRVGPWGPEGDSGSGSRAWLARVLGNPDNPLGWSIRLFRVAGITVRIHLFTIVFLFFMIVWSILPSQMGFGFMALAMTSLLLVVLAHEFGHCFACRWMKGDADRIVLLPIGGLALTRPVETWQAHLVTSAGGPVVNVMIVPFLVAALFAVGLGDHVVFNPLVPGMTLSAPEFQASSTVAAYAKVGLWWLHYTNIAILAFNALVPAFPLDGGRMLQALLWPRLGYRRAMEATVVTGFVAGTLLIGLGLAANQTIVVAVAALCVWSCWMERRRIRGEAELGLLEASFDEEQGDDEAAKRREAVEDSEQAELDRILAKIGASGMTSLTRRERKTLESATKKRRAP